MKNRVAFLALVLTASALQAQTPAAAPDAATQRAADYVVAHYQTPEDYVVSKFKDHDLVFLGEHHMVKEELQFLQKLIPKLYAAGVRNLGFEMSWSEDQAAIDQLINADTFDNDKALGLLYQWDPGVGWAFQEYADVFRAAWTLNHGLKKGAPRFRIIAIDLRPDWALAHAGDQVNGRQQRWQAWWGSNQIARNVWMFSIIKREFLDPGQKALLYNGSGHTTLRVTKDQREETGLRFSAAYQVRRRIGNRVTSIVMFSGQAPPATPNASGGMPPINALLAALPADKQMIGFDLKPSPVGDLPLPEPLAATIVGDPPARTLADYVAEGVVQIALKPTPVTLVRDFITPARVEQAKKAGLLPNVPEITAASIVEHQQQFLAGVR